MNFWTGTGELSLPPLRESLAY